MPRYLVQSREQTVVNTDPQRRCYNGCNFSEAKVWSNWANLYDLPTLEEAEESCTRWRDLAKLASRKLEYRVVPVMTEAPKQVSPQMQAAIAGLVRDEDDDRPPRTDEEVRGYGLVHDLTRDEIEQLVEIARGPIGY